jgi:hypothetical protein
MDDIEQRIDQLKAEKQLVMDEVTEVREGRHSKYRPDQLIEFVTLQKPKLYDIDQKIEALVAEQRSSKPVLN